MRIKWFLINEQTWIPFTQGCIVPSLVEIGPMVMEKKIFKFRQYIFDISELSSLGKGLYLHLNNLEGPSPRDELLQIWLTFHGWFGNFVNVFLLFRNSLKWAKNPGNLDNSQFPKDVKITRTNILKTVERSCPKKCSCAK